MFEDAWKSGPESERGLWRALAQTAVGLTHAARGNATGGARLLRRGADGLVEWQGEGQGVAPAGLDTAGLVRWAQELAGKVERSAEAVDAAAVAPRLT